MWPSRHLCPAGGPALGLARARPKGRRSLILHWLLLSIVDIALALSLAVLVLVAFGLITLIVRFLLDERRSGPKPARAFTSLPGEIPHVLVQLPVFNEPALSKTCCAPLPPSIGRATS